MKNAVVSYIVGLLFAIGLGISGMTQPQKVINFLDFFRSWDPSLLFVMVGAIVIHYSAYFFIRKLRKTPLLDKEWHIPTKKDITPSLVVGSILFGIGWGLGGFCPGPAITSLFSFEIKPIAFIISMIVGMILFRIVDHRFKFKR